MSIDFVRRFSSLFTADMHSPERQPWTSKIDVDSMVEAMAAKRNVSDSHVLLIKKLLAPTDLTPDHPVYPVMIEEAISSLNDGKGCSKDEIADFISSKYTVSPVVNFARLPLELDKCVRDEIIAVTSGNLYIARAITPDGRNAGSSGGELKRYMRRKKLRGDGSSTSVQWRKVKQSEQRIDDPVAAGETEIEGGDIVMDEDVPPGFEGCIKPCKRVADKVVELRESGENGGPVDMQEQSAEEVSLLERALVVVDDPLEDEDQIQPTPLCSMPCEEDNEGEQPAQVDPVSKVKENATLKKLHKKCCEIKSCMVRPEEEERKMMLQEKHDQMMNKINDLSAIFAKLREGLQFDEAGNKKDFFEEEHYKEILEQTEALGQTVKEAITITSEAESSKGTTTTESSKGTTTTESSKGTTTTQHKPSRKTKHVRWSPELDVTPPVNSRLERKRPLVLKIRIDSPPLQKQMLLEEEPYQSSKRQKLTVKLENQMESKCLKRELVCGLKIQREENSPRKRRFSQGDQVRSRVAKGLNRTTERVNCEIQISWKGKGPRSKRKPRIKRLNTEEFTTLDGKCTQTGLQLQMQDSSQPDEAMHRDMSQLSSSEHVIQLQHNGKAHEVLGSQIQARDFCAELACTDQQNRDIQQSIVGRDERIPPEVTTVRSSDHLGHLPNEWIQQLVEDRVVNQPKELRLQNEVSNQPQHNVAQNLLDRSDQSEQLPHTKVERCNQQEEQNQVESPGYSQLDNQQPEEEKQKQKQLQVEDLQNEVSNQPQHAKAKGCQGEAHNLLDRSDHPEEEQHQLSQEQASSEQNLSWEQKPVAQSQTSDRQNQVENQVMNQPGEQLKLQSEVNNQSEQLPHTEVERCNQQEDQNQCQGEAHSLLEGSDHPEDEQEKSQVSGPQNFQKQVESPGYSQLDNQQPEEEKQLQVEDLQNEVSSQPQHAKAKGCEGEAQNLLDRSDHPEEEQHQQSQEQASNEQNLSQEQKPTAQSQTSDQQNQGENQVFNQPGEELKLQSEVKNQSEQLPHTEVERCNEQEDQNQCQGEAHCLLEESDHPQEQQEKSQVSSQQNLQQQVESPGYSQQQALIQPEEELKSQSEISNQQELPQNVEAEGSNQGEDQNQLDYQPPVQGQESDEQKSPEQQHDEQSHQFIEQEEMEFETEEIPVLESGNPMAETLPSVQKKHQQAKLVAGEGRMTRARATAVAEARSPPSLSTRNSKKQKTLR